MAKITASDIRNRKGHENKIVAVTAYDYTFAKWFDSEVDVILVGDSLGMVVQGRSNTLAVTLEDMVYHGRSVARGVEHAHLVVDMPFMTYQADAEDAIRNAGLLLAKGGAEAVKLEGGVAIAPTIERLVDLGIPVMGHVGLLPQRMHEQGGYRVQGKTPEEQESIFQDALAIEDAGAYAVVLEGIPSELARKITERLVIPTIGIGAGSQCDGQILVSHDMLGLNRDFHPRFVKHYAELGDEVTKAVSHYAADVRQGKFPSEEHTFS